MAKLKEINKGNENIYMQLLMDIFYSLKVKSEIKEIVNSIEKLNRSLWKIRKPQNILPFFSCQSIYNKGRINL